jgi:deazaflavin-dependent oxidoreductase (nitroreductase family)
VQLSVAEGQDDAGDLTRQARRTVGFMAKMTDRLNDLTASIGARALRTRWLVRAPIRLYRAGLGFVFGNRLLMLEHVGRVSGERRYVVLEVVDRPSAREYVIVSGFGPTSQWYRNVAANPRVRVSSGSRKLVPATAALMSEAESAEALRDYAARHPRAWTNLRATIEAAVEHPVTGLPMVRLQLDG